MKLRILLLGLLLAACSSSPIADPDAPGSLTLTANFTELLVGDGPLLVAVVRNNEGVVLPKATVTWSTDNPSVATVGADGRLRALLPGTVTATAHSGAAAASRTFTVNSSDAAAITILPSVPAATVGASIHLTADVRTALGHQLQNAPVEWSVNHPELATVSAYGDLIGSATGTVTVTARSGGASAVLDVPVLPAIPGVVVLTAWVDSLPVGAGWHFRGAVHTTLGTSLPDAPLTWSVDKPALAAISLDGIVTALSSGRVVVTVRSGAAVTSHTVTIGARGSLTPYTVTISPLVSAYLTGQSAQLSATVTGAGGQLLPNTHLVWSSDHPEILSISSSGMVVAQSPGYAVITARSDSLVGAVTVAVLGDNSGPRPPSQHRLAFIRILGSSTYIEVIAEDGATLAIHRPTTGFITGLFADAPTAALSPDGSTIAYDCPAGVCLVSTSDESVTALPNLIGDVHQPSWSVDGKRLGVRSSYLSDAIYDLAAQAYVTSPNLGYVNRPLLAPSGRTFVHQCDFYAQYDGVVDLCRLDIGGTKQLYRAGATAFSFSPDGALVAYGLDTDYLSTRRSLIVEPFQQQYVASPPGQVNLGTFDNLTETAWSPDGQRLALVRNGELWMVDLPGAINPVRIAFIPGSSISSISWR